MSHDLARIRRKIQNTEDMQSVVKMMKAMASASLMQFKRALSALQEYQHAVDLSLSVCLRNTADHAFSPSADLRVQALDVIVFGTDQGMVGPFNEHLVDAVHERFGLNHEPVRLWVVGDRLRLQMENTGFAINGYFPCPASADVIGPLVSELLAEVEREHGKGTVRQVDFCHHAPEAGSNYETRWERLLPLDKAWRNRYANISWPTKALPEMVEAGGGDGSALIREHLFVSLFKACVESCVAENAARLAAMYRAEENIKDRRHELDLEYNHGRQSAIDEELFDLIAGYEAREGR